MLHDILMDFNAWIMEVWNLVEALRF